ERRKKRKTLDVVPVRVSKQEMTAYGVFARRHEAPTQIMSAGAAIQDNQRPVCSTHLHAGGVAPVANRARSRLCQRPARPPEPNPYVFFFLPHFLHPPLTPFNPQPHFHPPHHCDAIDDIFLRLLYFFCPPIQFTQTDVAVSYKRPHSEFFS